MQFFSHLRSTFFSQRCSILIDFYNLLLYLLSVFYYSKMAELQTQLRNSSKDSAQYLNPVNSRILLAFGNLEFRPWFCEIRIYHTIKSVSKIIKFIVELSKAFLGIFWKSFTIFNENLVANVPYYSRSNSLSKRAQVFSSSKLLEFCL